MSIEGSLEDASVAGLLQMLCGERRTARLMVWADSGTGTLVLEGGRVRHAELGAQVGDQAVIEVLAWSEGVFRVDPAPPASPRTVASSLTELLGKARRGGSRTAVPEPVPVPVPESDLILLLSNLDRKIVALAAERQRGPEGDPLAPLGLLEELMNEVLRFLTQHRPELVEPARLMRLREPVITRHPGAALIDLSAGVASLAMSRVVLRQVAGQPQRIEAHLLEVGRGAGELVGLWLDEVAAGYDPEARRREWQSAFGAVREDLKSALEGATS
ncbi:MAG TPA: DUF4388 domain-containing protein [Thermoanaerobaculia bacterium]|nr:DUF4388 domain-containing protein [Thermoanaerobaculia bacterium]